MSQHKEEIVIIAALLFYTTFAYLIMVLSTYQEIPDTTL